MDPTIANVEQEAAWDGAEGAYWAEHHEHYERSVALHSALMLQAAGITHDEDVLDIGCGSGGSTCDAARVARDGSALGVDLSGAMLKRARSRAAAEQLTNVRFERADAQVQPFEPASVDVAISRFGAMFFEDPVAAFSNIAGALRPDGRLALVAWREMARNEWQVAVRGALAAGRELPDPPGGIPGPFGLAVPERTYEILEQSGYSAIDLEPINESVVLGTDSDDAFAFLEYSGIVRGLVADLDDRTRQRAFDTLRKVLAQHDGPNGVAFASSAWLITARHA